MASSHADIPIDQDDMSNEAIRQAIANSIREVNLSSSSISSSESASKVGLEAVADMLHPDLSKLTEEEQINIATKASEAELSEDEKNLLKALEESKKEAQKVDSDEDLQKAILLSKKEVDKMKIKQQESDSDDEFLNALARSVDPNEQVVPWMSDLAASGASAIPNLEDLELEKQQRKSRQVSTMASRIAAKHGHQGRVLDNEAKYMADMKKAIDESLKQVEMRSVSMSPPPLATSGLNGYSRIVGRSGSQGTAQAGMPAARQPLKAKTYTYKASQKGQYRPVIVDGCNVGFAYGRNEAFVAKGLEIVYNHFKEKGYEDSKIVIIIKHIPKQYLTPEDEYLLEELDKIGVLHQCQGRYVGGERLQPDDDLFILETAMRLGGVVLSNDRYKKYWETHVQYRDIIRSRLIQPTFIAKTLILPVDPLGNKGPSLDQFLRFDTD